MGAFTAADAASAGSGRNFCSIDHSSVNRKKQHRTNFRHSWIPNLLQDFSVWHWDVLLQRGQTGHGRQKNNLSTSGNCNKKCAACSKHPWSKERRPQFSLLLFLLVHSTFGVRRLIRSTGPTNVRLSLPAKPRCLSDP